MVSEKLTVILATATEGAIFASTIESKVNGCEASGGRVEDVKLSTARASWGVDYTALILCRRPTESDTESEGADQ